MTIDTLIAEMEARREKRLASTVGSYPRSRLIASDLHDCMRHDVLSIVAWRSRAPFDTFVAGLLEAGRVTEAAVMRQLDEEGWQVELQQLPFELRDKLGRVILTGKIDGMLRIERNRIPFEVKDTGWARFRMLQDAESLKRDVWARKWWRQMQAYLIGFGYEVGLFILVHRGERRLIPVQIDYEEAESILRRAEQAQDVAELLAETPTDRVDHALNELRVDYLKDAATCRSCPFFGRACFPPLEHTGGEMEVEPELEPTVKRYLETADAAKEHEAAEKELRSRKGRTVLAGQYVVTGAWQERNMKPQPAKPAGVQKAWLMKIVPIAGEQGGTK
jgi:hypothetical protein